MNRKEQRQIWRRARASEVRQERLITEYIRTKHPVVYNEAATVYNQLNEKYPEKPDLRKTKEFNMILSGISTSSKYPRDVFPNITLNVQPTFVDNMQLRIPLLTDQSSDQSPVQSSVPDQSSVQSPVQSSVPDQSSVQSSVPVQSPVPVQFQVGEIPQVEITVQTSEDLHPIDDSVLEEIMKGLREDPTLHTFFQDWDFKDDDCPMW